MEVGKKGVTDPWGLCICGVPEELERKASICPCRSRASPESLGQPGEELRGLHLQPACATSPESLLEMLTPRPHCRSTEAESTF